MSFDNCPKFLRPRLRLFLSADIVGSTALKQSPFGTHTKAEQRTSWFSKIQGFYFEAHRAFLHEWEAEGIISSGGAESLGPAPILWKTIGDEVLFVKQLTDHRQLVETLRCWMRAVETMRTFVKKDNSRLDVKCTAWLAGFPFRNSEVAVATGTGIEVNSDGDWFVEGGKLLNRMYDGDEVKAIVDYIGPSIDIGFRLSAFSSSRRFVISVDIAFVLALANPGSAVDDPVFKVYYDGSEVLKGVLGGLRYPVFWLDLSPSSSLDRFEDNLTTLTPVNRDRLRDFCNRFYVEHASYTFPPFIVSKTEQQICDRPSWYEEDHAKLVKNFEAGIAPEAEEGSSPEQSSDQSEANATKLNEFVIHLTKLLKHDPPDHSVPDNEPL